MCCKPSCASDYVLRQKLGGTNLTYNYIQQLPMPSPDRVVSVRSAIEGPVDQLNSQRPDPAASAELRAGLDALVFHLYGLGRDEVDYILETFPIVKRKDEKAFGEFRTKRLILEAYDRLTAEGAVSSDQA